MERRIPQLPTKPKPAQLKTTPAPPPRRAFEGLGPLGRWLDRFISAPAPSDPLYMSNRTPAQKLRRGLMIAAPVLVAGFALIAYLGGYFGAATPRSGAPINLEKVDAKTLASVAKSLPNLDAAKESIRIERTTDLEVSEVHITRGAKRWLEGTVRNNTDHHLGNAEIIFDITDDTGSQMGATSVLIDSVDPKKPTRFRQKLNMPQARLPLVRNILLH